MINSFCEQMKACRVSKKLSLRKCAKEMGVSPSYLSELERGLVGLPTIKTIASWAGALNFSKGQAIISLYEERRKILDNEFSKAVEASETFAEKMERIKSQKI